jgi:hypothetical protein
MTILKRLNAFCLAALIAATPFVAKADAGHDHGPAPMAAAGSGPPRFAAVSETFELVGVLSGNVLTLYLDRADDNSPVKDARLDVELDGVKLDVKPQGEGEFEAKLAQALKPGLTAVTATVAAGQETDLLAGELDLRESAKANGPVASFPWKKYATWSIAALLTVALLGWGLRRLRTYRINRLGSTK